MSLSNSTTVVDYRELPRLPGYRFGDDGSAWSRWRPLGTKKGQHGGWTLGDEWRRIKICVTTRGGRLHMPQVSLRGKTYRVGRLVLEAFVGPCPTGMECRHLDGDPSNNRLGNLSWGTHQENMNDMARHGTHVRGEGSANARFTDADIRAIRARRAEGEKLRVLSHEYGTNTGNISRIVRRLAWKHVG